MNSADIKRLEKEIRKILKSVILPEGKQSVVAAGMIESVSVNDAGEALIIMLVDPQRGGELEPLRQDIDRAVCGVGGLSKVSVVMTAKRDVAQTGKLDNARRKGGVRVARAAADPHGMNKNPVIEVPARHIIVVASGKGGVGKSTVSSNMAAYLADNGHKVGLLDADIYGPSQPLMMGDDAYKPALNKRRQLIPLERHGVKIMSIGFIADSSKALVWRGPMVQTAFYQLLRDVEWGSADDPLDYLIIDLPPGTGDVQLTLAQKVKVSGAVIISTPQDIALIDARRAVEMFQTTHVPVLGLVENMSMHTCSNCGHEDHIFGHGGAEKEAETLGVRYLGALSLSKNIRLKSDEGAPIVIAEPDSSEAKAFSVICENIISALDV